MTIAVLSALVLAWYLWRAIKADRMRSGRKLVWERRDCGYADTPQGLEAAEFEQWSKEMET